MEITKARTTTLLLVTVLGLLVPSFATGQTTEHATCLIGSHPGIDDADAETAAGLVCDEVRMLGVEVDDPVGQVEEAFEVFRVSVSQLGDTIVLELSYESPMGEVKDRHRVQIASIGDVFNVASQVASAIVNSESYTQETTVTEEPTQSTSEAGQTSTTGGPICLVGDHSGVPLSDAETAASLTCDALRGQGVSVGAPVVEASDASEVYRVTLRRLGEMVILELRHENPVGTTLDSRTIQLASIEEVVVGGPRLAEALVQGLPIEETAAVGNLVGQETREPGQMAGSTFGGVGILGFGMIGTDIFAAPGVIGKFFYEATDWSVGGDALMGGGSPSGDDDVFFFILSIGARYFFNEANTSFFAGGGFAWDTFVLSRGPDDGSQRDGTSTGVGAYGEVGVEFMRMYSGRLIVNLRADIPFFSVEEQSTILSSGQELEDHWVMPISLGVTYAW